MSGNERRDPIETFHFFWGGPLSQWHACHFEIAGCIYNCAEQYMMAGKARLFADQERLALIMHAAEAEEQQRLGKLVTPFVEAVWLREAWAIVKTGNRAKFSQNPDLMAVLLATRGSTLAEASPKDRLWGIGVRERDERARQRDRWPGRNWLGEVLTELRDEFIDDFRPADDNIR